LTGAQARSGIAALAMLTWTPGGAMPLRVLSNHLLALTKPRPRVVEDAHAGKANVKVPDTIDLWERIP
jgi:hypothetical protein